uniref:Cytochrome b5 heme-binding domain-containing protein n=1 Tax=Eptatretus burgeri TaxID=7764 RepID=A0A8C4RA59_EPTBU
MMAAADGGLLHPVSECVVRLADVKKIHGKDKTWVIIHGKVYDVTTFHCHPGGMNVLEEHSGRDSTEVFEDIGHSNDARGMLCQFYMATIHPDDLGGLPNGETPPDEESWFQNLSYRSALYFLVPAGLALVAVAVLVYRCRRST